MEIQMHKVTFGVTLTSSLALGIAGFILPPTGVIDPSVLTFAGEMLGFATIGQIPHLMKRGADFKVTHGNTTIEVDNPDDQPAE